MSQYLLASDAEQERLRLQARVWEAEAEALLDQIGVQPGWRCLDLGCGAMGILGPLSRRVGPRGHVIGIDADASLLAAAHVYVQAEGLTNVELLQGDARDTGLPRASFDLVHERFVLPHVTTPEAVLDEMIALAKPGGIIAVQEPDNTSWNFFPTSAKWGRLKQILIAAFALRGDIDIGQRTFGMLRQAGLQDVTVRAAVLALHDNHPYMRMALVAATTLRPHIVRAGLATEAELDDLLADVERLAADPETLHITFTTTQVWGRTAT